MRGIPGFIYETSLLDAEEGIRFRGYTIEELQVRAFRHGEPARASLGGARCIFFSRPYRPTCLRDTSPTAEAEAPVLPTPWRRPSSRLPRRAASPSQRASSGSSSRVRAVALFRCRLGAPRRSLLGRRRSLVPAGSFTTPPFFPPGPSPAGEMPSKAQVDALSAELKQRAALPPHVLKARGGVARRPSFVCSCDARPPWRPHRPPPRARRGLPRLPQVLDALPTGTHAMTQLSVGLMAMQPQSKFAAAYSARPPPSFPLPRPALRAPPSSATGPASLA